MKASFDGDFEPNIAQAEKPEVPQAMGLATHSAQSGITFSVFICTVRWRGTLGAYKRQSLAVAPPLLFENLAPAAICPIAVHRNKRCVIDIEDAEGKRTKTPPPP